MKSLFLAWLAGMLTTLNPCVLPMLPFVFASALRESRWGPLALMGGLSLTFTLTGIALAALGPAIGISPEGLRSFGAALMLVLGLAMIIPRGQMLLATAMGPLANSASGWLDRWQIGGARGQFLAGAFLGLIWSPCTGPALGAAVGLASQGGSLAAAAVTMLVFSLGVTTVMLALAYGSRRIFAGSKARLMAAAGQAKLVFGVIFAGLGLFILTGLDRKLDVFLLGVLPDWLLAVSTRF